MTNTILYDIIIIERKKERIKMFNNYLELIKKELEENGEVRFYHDVDTIIDNIEKIYKRKLIYKVTRINGTGLKIEKRFRKKSKNY